MGAPDRTLRIAVVVTTLLGLGKLAAAWYTNSQAVFTSAVDSLSDGAISLLNALLLRQAHRPADEGHPFGHGKLEGLAALGQGLVLAAVVAVLAVEALQALASGAVRTVVAGPAAVAMVASLAVSFGLSTALTRAAARSGSLVLRTDAVHYRMDLLSGLAVLAGLAVTGVAGLPRADAVAALAVCAIMSRDVAKVLREAVDELMDRPFEPHEQEAVRALLRQAAWPVLSWHDLRTRKAGPHRFVQVHVVLPAELPFREAHRVTDEIEAGVRTLFPSCDVIVHADVEGDADRTDVRRAPEATPPAGSAPPPPEGRP